MKKCPFCAEEIQDDAIICRYCNNSINKNTNEKVPVSKHPNYTTISLVSVLLPMVGIIIGIVYLTKKDLLDKKLGEHAIAFSLLASILWYAVYIMLTFFNISF